MHDQLSSTAPTALPAPISAAAMTATYESQRDYVLSVLRRRCRWLEESDREAIFHDAYVVMLEKERRRALDADQMHPQQVRAYLVQTALHKALDEGKRAGRRRSVPIEDEDVYADEASDPVEDQLDAKTDSARLREIVAELPERQQAIVKLRFFFDRSPAEIQRYLGVTERVYRRELERAMKQISRGLALVRAGDYCESRRSLILAYVSGLAGPNRALDARRHLETCTACSHWAGELRLARQRVAALAPVPLVTLAVGRRSWLRMRLLELTSSVQHHTSALAVRADTSSLPLIGAARPGAVAAAVVGCVALGGGVSVCAINGLPISILSGRPHHHAKPRPRPRHALGPERARPTTTPGVTSSGPPPLLSTHSTPSRTSHPANGSRVAVRAPGRPATTPRSASRPARASSRAVTREFGPAPVSSTAPPSSSTPPSAGVPTGSSATPPRSAGSGASGGRPGEFDP